MSIENGLVSCKLAPVLSAVRRRVFVRPGPEPRTPCLLKARRILSFTMLKINNNAIVLQLCIYRFNQQALVQVHNCAYKDQFSVCYQYICLKRYFIFFIIMEVALLKREFALNHVGSVDFTDVAF